MRLLTPPIIPILLRRLFKRNVSAIPSGLTVGKNSAIKGKIDLRHPNSQVSIGENCLIEGFLSTETDGSLIMLANNVFIGGDTILDCVKRITIQENVLISYRCIIADSDNHSTRYSIRKNDLLDWQDGGKHDWSTTLSQPILIKKGAWIGAQCIILKGVTIGEGAVVGAGSVVTQDVPDWTVVAGNPARTIKEIPEDER